MPSCFADSRLTRKTPPTYGDGVYTINGGGRPSPRTLSQAFMKGYDGLGSLKNRTALATFFGKEDFRGGGIQSDYAYCKSDLFWWRCSNKQTETALGNGDKSRQ